MKKLRERLRWWIHHPRYELIYLLGGVPNEHNGGVLHYRNLDTVIRSVRKLIEKSEKQYEKSNKETH